MPGNKEIFELSDRQWKIVRTELNIPDWAVNETRSAIVFALARYKENTPVDERIAKLIAKFRKKSGVLAVRAKNNKFLVLAQCTCGCGDKYWVKPASESGCFVPPAYRLCIASSGSKTGARDPSRLSNFTYHGSRYVADE